MDEHKKRELNDYLDLLFWTETASESEIQGAITVASGITKEDLKMAVKCMIESDQPGLALYFPELVTNRLSLSDLRGRHSGVGRGHGCVSGLDETART